MARARARGWQVALRNLLRNRRRNLATAAAIALGYAGLVVLGGYATRIERFLRTNAVYLQHAGHVTVWLAGGFQRASAEPEKMQLDPVAQAKIFAAAARDPRIEFAARYLRGVGLAGNGCTTLPSRLLGLEPQALARIVGHPEVRAWSPEIAEPVAGRWIGVEAEAKNPSAVAAGLATLLGKPRVWAQTRGLPPAPTVIACDTPAQKEQLARDADVQLVSLTYDGTLNAIDTEMVATFHATESLAEDGSMIASLATLQTLFSTDRVTYVALFLHRAEDARAVAAELTAALRGEGLAVEAFPYDDERANPYYVGTMAFLGSMVGFITVLVTMVLVLTVLGAMTLTILERAREIGTWRALGFRRRFMIALVVREAFLLGVIGLGAGLLLGLAAALAINAAGIRFAPPGVAGTIQLLIHPSVIGCAIQAALLLPGICAAAWIVVRGQVRRGVVDLLTAQSG